MIDQYDSYEFDTTPQPLIKWLEKRLRQGKRDAIDNPAKRLIADERIPRKGSLGTYRSHLSVRKYSRDDLQVFEQAWTEMKTEQLESE